MVVLKKNPCSSGCSCWINFSAAICRFVPVRGTADLQMRSTRLNTASVSSPAALGLSGLRHPQSQPWRNPISHAPAMWVPLGISSPGGWEWE